MDKIGSAPVSTQGLQGPEEYLLLFPLIGSVDSITLLKTRETQPVLSQIPGRETGGVLAQRAAKPHTSKGSHRGAHQQPFVRLLNMA